MQWNARRFIVNDKPDSGSTDLPSFDAIMKYLISVIATIGDKDAFTYSPRSGRMYDVTKPGHGGALFQELVTSISHFRPDVSIYLIGLTDNTDISANDALKRAFKILMLMTDHPLFGTWVNEAGKRCLDLVIAVQFIREYDAIMMGKWFEQDSIVRIDPSGKAVTIKVR